MADPSKFHQRSPLDLALVSLIRDIGHHAEEIRRCSQGSFSYQAAESIASLLERVAEIVGTFREEYQKLTILDSLNTKRDSNG